MFCLSDELINLVSPFPLQLFFSLALVSGWGAWVRVMPRADCPSLQSTAVQGQLWEQWWAGGGFSFGFHFTGTRLAQAVAQVTAKSEGSSC